MLFLPPAYVVRREGNVLTCVCPSIHQSVCPQGGYPYPIMLCNISQNAMGQTPRGGTLPGPAEGGLPCWGEPCRGDTLLGGVPCWGGTLSGVPCQGVGGTLLGVPCWGQGVPCWGVPCWGYPVRTTEGVLTTQRAVCLLRSRRRTFLFVLTWTCEQL